ncbi:CRISPR-associated helicase/endonuclease Cas3 [Sulfurospirillum cavolei]|uniref:CRISPR-associated helicase/endonuclease Cas3 n=1 Tax=Sulfurospirillum cavolei TaxID=366522 RepID=UPI000764A838|nr:CRISPR-associated helicase/endonuclease Cas3 [Sulfurospirillum cavolei]
MEIIAKTSNEQYQTFEEHTQWVVEEALNQIDPQILHKVSICTGWSEQKIRDLIFFSAYFHDIGKATVEFQETINNGKKSYHPLYGASLLLHIKDFVYKDIGENNLLFSIVLSHHSLFPKQYDSANYNFTFLPQYLTLLENYSLLYQKTFNEICPYIFEFKELKRDLYKQYINISEKRLADIQSCFKFRVLYSYVSGILNLADWLASARFTQTKPTTTFLALPTKENFVTHLTFDKLRPFQEELSLLNKSVLVEIPTGEGKTEGSLLWAIYNLYNQNTKIIYTLPTQTTSNKLYDRIQNFFDKEECGLIHSTAKIFLEKAYEKENGIVDDVFQSDFLISKSFNKPITVSTIDSLLKYFINIGRFNIATKNFLNSVIIIDEVHAYDFKLMGFLKRFLELCQEYDVRVCLMSASIPNQLKKLLNIQTYLTITQNDLFQKKANDIIKKEYELDDDFDFIKEKFKESKNILIIRNTVKSAAKIYKYLKDEFSLKDEEIMLYHSTFKKIDKQKKEEMIFEKLKQKKPFILVATQIVEISLDIDFDVMFTDNAPIDGLIQRFGRVNRKKDTDKKGEIYIYKYEKKFPYQEIELLKLTFETIENGYFELGKYVEWLNIVYDKLFEEDIATNNKITRLFKSAYEKYDVTIKNLHGINQSSDNYDLRDIPPESQKNDYWLYDDFMDEKKRTFDYTISLPFYYEKSYLHVTQEKTFYKVLKLNYSFNEGIILEDSHNGFYEFGGE